MEAACAAIDGNGIFPVHIFCYRPLEFKHLGSESKVRGADDLVYCRDLFFRNVRT